MFLKEPLSFRENQEVQANIKNIAKGTTDPRVEFISQNLD